jgi:hypothetical protein
MKELLGNKAIMTLLIIMAIGLIYTFATGGFGGAGGDLPEFDSGGAAPPSQSSSASTTPPSTPASGAPSLAAGASVGAGGAVTAGGQTSPATPSQPTPGTGAGGGGGTKPTPSKTPSGGADTGINEKLEAFRNMNPDKILKDKYDELNKEVTPPEHFAEDIGRVDPLTVVYDFIPEELRPPREGETNEEEVFKFLEEAIGYEILDSIEIQVIEVLSLGNYKSVVATIQGQTMNIQEGQQLQMMTQEGFYVYITLTSVDRSEVIFDLTFVGAYAVVTRTRTFISGSY